MKYLEVDINFSLDYKNNENDTVWEFISNTEEVSNAGNPIVTLSKYDFVLHLCGHLYKEATTYPWVLMKRDMTMYKMCDLYLLLREYKEHDFEELFQRAAKLNMNAECYYALYVTRELFYLKNIVSDEFMSRLVRGMALSGEHSPHSLINKVVSPADKQTYWYESNDIAERFFAKDRVVMLKKTIFSDLQY